MAAGRRLHITNGDATGEMLKALYGGADKILCWRDVLHDGPLTLAPIETHTRRRAQFLADTLVALGDTAMGAAPCPRILADLRSRDEILADLGGYAAVILWFEHDLYDQLQLAEILFRLSHMQARPRDVSLVCIGSHPAVPFFNGLGDLTPRQLSALFPQRRPVVDAQLAAGRLIWTALCAPTPVAVQACSSAAYEGLPFMPDALERWCQEFPALSNGLTHSQHLLLQAIGAPLADLPLLRRHLRQQEENGRLPAGETAASRYAQVMAGPLRFGRIFLTLQTLERAPFMGDLWVRKELANLCNAPTPYLETAPSQNSPPHGPGPGYTLTEAGRKALAGQLHWAEVNDYDLWRGGVHLSQTQMWYWDGVAGGFKQAQV